MLRCDVLIVGAGPAGSSCAWGLRHTGLNVIVMDRHPFPRSKTCGGWITPPVFGMLELDSADYARQRTLQPIDRFRIGLIGGVPCEVTYHETVSYGILRHEFDHALLERCQAGLRLGDPCRQLERVADGWLINGEIQARLVVGAGGHFCPVAKMLGVRSEKLASVVTAQELEFRPSNEQLAQCRVRPECPELYFCEDLQGYGWCFRKGNHLNIGLGRLDPHRLPEHVGAFCDFLRQRGVISGPFPDQFHGHAYQLGERISSRSIDEQVLLVGDALGLAAPQSGEGIRPAIESGLLAAEVIASANGDYSRNRLERYYERLRSRYRTSGSIGPVGDLAAPVFRMLGRQLLRSRYFVRHVVLDRWFLHRHEHLEQSGTESSI